MPTDKYKEFRNFMFNEMQITREDVKQWVREAVNDKAADVINQTCSEEYIRQVVKDSSAQIARSHISQQDAKKAICSAISDVVYHTLDIKVSNTS